MKLTAEQMNKFYAMGEYYKKNTGMDIDIDAIIHDISSNLDHMEFFEAYEKTYFDAIQKQIIPAVTDEIKKGKEPNRIGSYFGAVMDCFFDTLADEKTKEEDAKVSKYKGTDRWNHHVNVNDYSRILNEAFRDNNHKFKTMPRYLAIADRKATSNLDFVNHAVSMMDIPFTNMRSAIRTGDLTIEEFKSTLAAVAESYMVLNTLHNRLPKLSKWFGKGRQYRGLMGQVKDSLKEGQEYLIKHGYPEMKNYNIRDELHRIGVLNEEVVGTDAETLNNVLIMFDGELGKEELPEENVFNYPIGEKSAEVTEQKSKNKVSIDIWEDDKSEEEINIKEEDGPLFEDEKEGPENN